MRICGDYSVTLNRFKKVEHYPLPRLEDLFSILRGGQTFTKIDLSDAYHQVELREQSKSLTTITSHQGLYQYERLCFGLSSAPSIFLGIKDSIIKGLDSTVECLEDFLGSGRPAHEHLANLKALLDRLEQRGVRLNLKKCHFFKPSIEYLGHVIDSDGIHTSQSKVKSILDTPRPETVEKLHAFLGLINYYGRFVPHLSSRCAPLYRLLQKDVTFTWSEQHQHCFDDVKKAMSTAPILAHYDES